MKYLLDSNILLEPMKPNANARVIRRLVVDDGVRKQRLSHYFAMLKEDGLGILPFFYCAAE